jgi:hypothetical protein
MARPRAFHSDTVDGSKLLKLGWSPVPFHPDDSRLTMLNYTCPTLAGPRADEPNGDRGWRR